MIGAFLSWWVGQLADLLPSWTRRSALSDADAVVIAPTGPIDHSGSISAGLRRNGREVPLGEFALATGELNDLPMSAGLPVVLRLTKRDVLEKTLVLPLAAQADLDQVLTFEMDRETPFTAEELYWSHRIASVDRQRQQLQVRLLLLPKARLVALMAALAAAAIVPSWAEIAADGGTRLCLPLDGAGRERRERSRRLLWPAAVCCGLLALAAVVTPFVRQAIVAAALDREIRLGRATAAQAEALRRDIARLSRGADLVNQELQKAGRPVQVLATVTRVLPDDTYLTELELEQGKLTISGRSGGAARLIGAFAADGNFRNPAFTAPITRLEALHAEVFTIVADVGPQP